MKDRRCVLLLFYDVPMGASADRRKYKRFRSSLISSGFCAMQESVYVKLLHNRAQEADAVKEAAALAPNGNVSVLTLSLPTFRRMRTLRGTPFDVEKFSDDILYF